MFALFAFEESTEKFAALPPMVFGNKLSPIWKIVFVDTTHIIVKSFDTFRVGVGVLVIVFRFFKLRTAQCVKPLDSNFFRRELEAPFHMVVGGGAQDSEGPWNMTSVPSRLRSLMESPMSKISPVSSG